MLQYQWQFKIGHFFLQNKLPKLITVSTDISHTSPGQKTACDSQISPFATRCSLNTYIKNTCIRKV